MEINDKISKLMSQCNLGQVIKNPTRVNGGLSHRMYKVETEKRIYAVKELNSGIMKRKEALGNFIFSEKVTEIAKQNGISAIGSKKINNQYIQKVNGSYFMIFDWIEGKVLKAEEITEKHCEIIGQILANIHNIDFSSIENEKDKDFEINEFNWRKYLDLSKVKNMIYAKELEENIDWLDEISKKTIDGMKFAKNTLVVSHTDLDRKNVIWKNDIPYVIDWEASNYTNPTIELIQVAWYWSGGDVENIDYNKFEKVVKSYIKYSKQDIDDNIDKLVFADIYGGLNWIEYNLKRSMCIENEYDREEIELAEQEVLQSINEIKYNIAQIDKIIEIIRKNINKN